MKKMTKQEFLEITKNANLGDSLEDVLCSINGLLVYANDVCNYAGYHEFQEQHMEMHSYIRSELTKRGFYDQFLK